VFIPIDPVDPRTRTFFIFLYKVSIKVNIKGFLINVIEKVRHKRLY
jgi:hypothetical protein